tara:strand:- start:167 stop:571 length:405 start_codon:yes stop_codon:yes gene_type:complete
MGTLTATLILKDSTTFSDEINFSLSKDLTTTAPSQSLSTIVATATGSQSIIIPASTAIRYLYVKHSGTTDGSTSTTRQVDVEFTTDEAIARLSAGEFLFMPVHHAEADVGVQLHVQHSSSSDVVQLEYAFFAKG